MRKEEQILFPLPHHGSGKTVGQPILMMRHEHTAHVEYSPMSQVGKAAEQR
jgi:iron-sulfur cluster repair protein YtfE (RIC family)